MGKKNVMLNILGKTSKLSIFCLLLYVFLISNSFAVMYRFSGGPSGGNYHYYARAIAKLANNNKIGIKVEASGGSIENIQKVDNGIAQFAIAYSGHVYHAMNGTLKGDSNKYKKVLVLGYLYGAPAQLVVRKKSKITSAKQMAGLKIGVGNKGSGAAATSELFFKELGIWDKLEVLFIGYKQTAEAFNKNRIDALWFFTGFPNPSISKAAKKNDIYMINTYNDAESAGMLKKYPYFSKIVIPANTYKGLTEDTNTFEDSALLISSNVVCNEDIYKLLTIIYSNKGIKYLSKYHESTKSISINDGLSGVVTPLHLGAEKFWKEKGILK